MMNDLQNYMLMEARKEAAEHQHNYTGMKLENASIHERLAQIKSQSDPLDSLVKSQLSERDRLYAAAFYVVVGRMPKKD